jgi:hypothetical protein
LNAAGIASGGRKGEAEGRVIKRSERGGLGRLARGERRDSRVLTKCQNAGANDWPRRARLDSAKPGMAEREGVVRERGAGQLDRRYDA